MTHPLSPTAVLPALTSLRSYNAARLQEALQVLREVYFPQDHWPTSFVPVLKQSLSTAVPAPRAKRATRLVHHDGVPDSGYASAEEDDDGEDEDEDSTGSEEQDTTGGTYSETEALDILRLDEIERSYAIKWLTGLIKRGDAWAFESGCSPKEESERTTVIENASRLLARFAGDDEPEEALTRTFHFPFRPGADASDDASPITIEMNDAPLNGDDHTAVGLQSWGSAIVLSKRLCANPERYLCLGAPTSTHSLRILELGAGTGMLSIAAAKVLARLQLSVSIIATDYHPSVLSNLTHNVRVNLPAVHTVAVEALDWSVPPKLADSELYDVVLAADVIYDPQHASWIRDCVAKTMRKDGVLWLIMPLRAVGRHEGLGKTVVEAFPEAGMGAGDEGRGAKLVVVHREEVDKLDGIGRADEGGYTLFEIRWV